MNKLLEGLNASQQAAIQHKDGPLLVLAGPGSGKTRVVTHRIAWLLEQGVRQDQIVALTFTNKAADEMKNRLTFLVPDHHVWIGTFHRFCAYLLRTYATLTGLNQNFTIYDSNQTRQLLESLVNKKEFPTGIDCQRISAAISWAKNNMVLPKDYQPKQGNILGEFVEKIYPEYQKALQAANAVDFDDLLLYIMILLQENSNIREQLDNRFRYILVDEYQDTNLIQYAIAKSLSVNFPNLAVTGDPDQSIYGWRGANIRNILDFEKDFENVKVIRLEQNYRSTKNILAVASALIKNNKYRKDKELFTENEDGVLPRVLRCFNHQEEADFIAKEIATEITAGKRRPQDYAIFYRMNALSRNLEHSLRRYGVPFQLIRGLEFFNRREIRDIIAYLQFIYNPNDVIAFRRIINLPTRGIGKVTQNRLEAFASENYCSLLEAVKSIDAIPKITAKTKKSIQKFVDLIERLGKMSTDSDLEVLISVLLNETNYLLSFQNGESEEEKQILANVQELLSEAREFDKMFNDEMKQESERQSLLPFNIYSFGAESRLERFLEQAALVSDVDAWDDQTDRVSLMTLHASKGLEFPVVYLIALEDKILPHERSIVDKMQLEEERRLLFVGITRAKEEIRLSRTQFREYRGTYCSSILSRFLFELPGEKINLVDRDGHSDGELASSLSQNNETSHEVGIAFSKLSSDPTRNVRSRHFTKRHVKTDDNTETVFETEINYEDVHEEAFEEPVFQYNESANQPSQSFADQTNQRKYIPEQSDEICFDENGLPQQKSLQKKSSKKRLDPLLPSAITFAAELIPSSKTSQDEPSLSVADIKVGGLIRHKNYGIGVVNKIEGPRDGRIATITFLSSVGTVEIPLSDADLKVISLSSS